MPCNPSDGSDCYDDTRKDPRLSKLTSEITCKTTYMLKRDEQKMTGYEDEVRRRDSKRP
jgi:hypothetical protein